MKRTLSALIAIIAALIWFENAGRAADGRQADPQPVFSPALQLIPADEQLLANPVFYDGAWYLITGTSEARHLYRVALGKIATNNLGFTITADSFAFVTPRGSLRILTKNAIASCDLTKFGSPPTVVTSNAISFDFTETPAVGPDGSMYFRNVHSNGTVVAYNPSLSEIWSTKLKFDKISPISLSPNGSNVWMLAEIEIDAGKIFSLVRINAATGEVLTHEIKYEETPGKEVFPVFKQLLKPAVASNGNVEYVFIAGNWHASGLMQLMSFDRSTNPPAVLWMRLGKVTNSPALKLAEKSMLFVFEDSSLGTYPWDRSKDRYQDSPMEGPVLSDGRVGALLVHGANSICVLDSQQEITRVNQESVVRLESLAKKESEASQELGQLKENLADLNGQIGRGRHRVAWALAIDGLMFGAVLLLSYWILRLRKQSAGRG